MKTTIVATCCAIICSCISICAQKTQLITTAEHLSNSLINQVYQDSRGYIWIATEDGLNRFDGDDIQIYRTNSTNPNAISSNYVHKVYEDSYGRLWIGTLSGLQIYSREYDNFQSVPIIYNDDTIKAHVTDIVEDKIGNIWIATSGRGVLKYDGQKMTPAIQNETITDFVSSIECDSRGNLWIVALSNNVVYKYIPTDNQIHFIHIENNRTLAENAFVKEIDGQLYLSVDNSGLYQLNEKKSTFYKCTTHINSFISAISAHNGKIFIGTDGDGLYQLDNNTNQCQKVDIFMSQIDFAKSKIHSILFDRSGNLWLGIFQKGVMLTPYSTKGFTVYGYKPNSAFNIGSSSVMSVMNDADGLWIGTDGDGLYHVDSDGQITHIQNVPKTIMDIATHTTISSKLLLACYDDGLIIFDKKTHSVTDVNRPLLNASSQYNGRVVSIACASDGKIMVGTYGSGFYTLNNECTHATAFISSSEERDWERNEPINNWINSIYIDNDKTWIGTYKGLSSFNIEQHRFALADSTIQNYLNNKIVFDITTDAKNDIWIATNDGIVKYNKTDHSVRMFTNADGLSSNTAVSVATDSVGNVWVGTYGGLSRIDAITNTISSFYSHDGIQGEQFSRAAVCSSTDGQLFFGGTNGLTSFSPHTIQPDTLLLRVEVTSLYINGREVKKGDTSDGQQIVSTAIIDADTFTFSYAEKSFALKLSSFAYIDHELVRYEYMLDGFDTEWHSTPQGISLISFTNLPPNTYKLHIRAKIGNNFSPIKTINIQIMPLWWQTWWAAVLYLFIFIGIGYFIYTITKQRRFIKEELIRQEHERNIEEAKFQFFFNISHEIRTPLTLIINPLKELMRDNTDDKQQNKYNIIYRNAMRILRLINQLLDIRKIEKGQMTMHFIPTNINNMIDEISQNFIYAADKKNIKMSIVNQLTDNIVAIDNNHFDKVIYNLYSNAIKYTPEGGEIETTISSANDNIIIEIADSGIGIAPDKLELIFNRFYQIDNQETAAYTGTGIGLHYSRSIITMHNGTITARNKATGHGAIFRIEIPRHQNNEETQTEAQQPTAISEADAYVSVVTENEKHKPDSNKKILIIDDEPEVNSYLVSELSKHYKTSSCTNGKEAYEMLLTEHFDAVISDVMMPIMDGITLCRKIKSNINISHLPVILLTAKHSDEDRNKGLLTGADAYIAKPFDIEILENTLYSIITNRERILKQLSTNNNETIVYKKVNLKSSDEILMEKITSYIDTHIADPTLNVEKLAEHVGMSRVHMHRKLKELTSQSARDYIKSIRLKQAGILLGEKKLNISEVAYALGFTNLSHFSSSFRDFYGISPTEYMNEKINTQDLTQSNNQKTNNHE